MEWMWRSRLVLFVLFFFAVSSAIFAQDSTVVNEPESQVQLREFDQKRWENLTKDVDYTESIKKKKKKRKSNFSLPNLNINVTFLKVVLITLVAGALIFLLWKIFGDAKFLNNQKIKNGDFSFLDEAEEDLENSDLENFLKEALANRQYKVAVRIYYLMVIKELMLGNHIVWEKNKTNFEYVDEMREKKEFEHFRSLTNAFEIVWYGDVEIEEKDFAVLSPSFGSFINTIRKNGQK